MTGSAGQDAACDACVKQPNDSAATAANKSSFIVGPLQRAARKPDAHSAIPHSAAGNVNDAIYVNLVGLNPAEGSELVLDVTTQGVTPVVPEPSTWALMLLGFAGLGWTGWRRGSARAI